MKKFLIAAPLMMAAAFSNSVTASTVVVLSTNQMVDASDAVVHGTITEVWTEEDMNGLVWTRAQVEVDRVLKGNTAKDAYVVDQMGGTFGGNQTTVPGRTRFSRGEEGVFFLEQLGSGRFSTVGMSQGKLTVRLDPYSREKIVQSFNLAPAQAYDHRFIPLPKPAERRFLNDFVHDIEARVEAGWDGQPIPGTSNERLERINRKEVAK